MTHTDTRAAMADQADWMREPTQEQIDQRARQMFVAHNRANGALYPDGFGFLSSATMREWRDRARADLIANAERLEKRTEEHIDMLPSISKHNGMVTP